MSNTAGIAVVGAGRMGSMHLRALSETRLARLAAVVEPVAETRERAAELHGAPGFGSIGELMESGLAEGVVITAPTDLHLGLVKGCLAAGMPVFCEKPCGLSADEAGRAAAAAATAGLPLQVGYYRRFLPDLVALRQRIVAGRLGELSLVVLNQWDEHPPSAEFERRSGGIVVDMGVHEIDQLRWLTGQEVEEVTALTPAPGDQSSAVISLRLSGGTLGVVTLGRRFPHPDSCWMEVVGTEGYERLPFVWAEQGEAAVLAGIAAELDAFAAAVRGAPMTGSGGADAVAALEVAGRIDRCLR